MSTFLVFYSLPYPKFIVIVHCSQQMKSQRTKITTIPEITISGNLTFQTQENIVRWYGSVIVKDRKSERQKKREKAQPPSPGNMKYTNMLVIAGLDNFRHAIMACDLLNKAFFNLRRPDDIHPKGSLCIRNYTNYTAKRAVYYNYATKK